MVPLAGQHSRGDTSRARATHARRVAGAATKNGVACATLWRPARAAIPTLVLDRRLPHRRSIGQRQSCRDALV